MQFQRMKQTNYNNNISAKVPFILAATLLATLAVTPAFAANGDIYKTVGPDGSIIFTDKLQENSVAVESRKMIPAESQPALDTRPRADEFSSDTLGGRENRKINVSAVQITSPIHNQTLIAPQEAITFTIATAPEKTLPEGYTTVIQMNGEVVSNKDATQIAVPVPDSGTHTFIAKIVSSNGKTLVQSEPIKVHVVSN